MSMGHAFAVIEAGIAYRSDIGKAIEIMRSEARKLREAPVFRDVIVDDLDVAGVDRWAESAVILKARLKTVPMEQMKVKREYLRRLKEAFDANGIEIPFPHLTVYPGEAAPFTVDVIGAART
jgi:small conductance mechanosensitive channel